MRNSVLPAAFLKALGKPLPVGEDKPGFNRNRQLREQRERDDNHARQRVAKGYDSFGFAFKKDEK
ncbi:MAG: hypothetical protein EON60_12070 [Alphaproteobacteria bacterium]|nr:MAG: hypothetical protein EON60_12070 [Alphaproteobacteria bacterium]